MPSKATKEEFVKKANKKHKNQYSYDNVIYVDAKSKISITCKNHGDFNQTPGDHLFGHGCPKCKADKKSCKWNDIQNLFFKVHKGYYKYDQTTYLRNSIKMKIICPVHGEFWQKPELHKTGSGCRKCTASGGPGKYCETIFNRNPILKTKVGFLYFIQLQDQDTIYYKIGITTSIYKRFYRFIEKNNGKILWTKEDTLYNCFLLEQELLNKNKEFLYRPTNLSIGGKTECLTKEIKYDF